MTRPLSFIPRPRELLVALLLLSLLASAKRVTRPQPLPELLNSLQQQDPSATAKTYHDHAFFKLARRWDTERGKLQKRDMEVRSIVLVG